MGIYLDNIHAIERKRLHRYVICEKFDGMFESDFRPWNKGDHGKMKLELELRGVTIKH